MQLLKNRIILAKVEATYGTDSVPVVATDALDCRNVKWGAPGEELKRDQIRGNISQMPSVIGKVYQEVSFDVELKGSGSIGVAGQLSDLLQACCLSETVSAGSSVVYVPADPNSQKGCTIYVYDLDSGSAVLKKVTGAIGDVTLKLTAGQIGVLSFSFKGLYNAPTSVALPGTPTYEATTPPIIQSAALSVNAVTTLVSKEVSIGLKNSIAERDDISSPYGIKAFFVTSRAPDATIPIEAVLPGTYDPNSLFVGSTAQALSVVIGTATGNKCTITAPKMILTKNANGDDGGILTQDLAFMLGLNAGNDELSIKFQ